MTDKLESVAIDARELIVSGGNAYGVNVPLKCRVWHDEEIEKEAIKTWNAALAAEAAWKTSYIQEEIEN